jgi:hypothetical protein
VVRVNRRVVAWVVAAVVTVALVGGGVLVARGGLDRSPAVLPVDPGATGQAGAAADNAATGRAAADAGAASEPAPAPGGVAPARPKDTGDLPRLRPRVTYRLQGALPSVPDRARAGKVRGAVDAGRVAALAAALGLDGRPEEERYGWTVRDGRRALAVHRLAGVPWTFGTDILGACGTRSGGPYGPGGGVPCLDPDAPVASAPASPGRPGRPLALPTRAEAERVARDLAARAGLDLAGATVRVTDGWATRTVTIDPAVGGAPTSGFAWRVSVGARGAVQHGSGYLATPEPADTYPLVGVREGYERLKKAPPFGNLPGPEPVPAIARSPCPAGAALPCEIRPLPERVVTVTGVRLGLQLAPAVGTGGRPADAGWLLPAHLFDLRGGWTDVRAIIAVPDRYLRP